MPKRRAEAIACVLGCFLPTAVSGQSAASIEITAVGSLSIQGGIEGCLLGHARSATSPSTKPVRARPCEWRALPTRVLAQLR